MEPRTSNWDVSKRYKTDVLIGNWFEERLVYDRKNHTHPSSYSIDFQQRGYQQPDVVLRRNGWIRSNGVGKEILLAHHGDAYKKNWITWYDEDFNGRGLPRNPPQRDWHSGNMAWSPERSDFPVQGSPTNWGLKERLDKRWNTSLQERSTTSKNDFSTTYNASYLKPRTEDLLAARQPSFLPPISGRMPANTGSQDKFEEPAQKLSVVAT
ncbi:hypothetical protein BOX15_Mlig028821g1 [Macrostomum lignano]|uniref:Uncharacterized protein n=1 Tax=Macrostomum lignano TaxID=282301 RepID=A0A267F1Z2_9PLAT|nr:hypothetical protein BOX15_Mlig028821g1 [Macrostomum lignano]